MPDIASLKELKNALELITPADFSRYAKLIALLKSQEYGWAPSKMMIVLLFLQSV